MKKRSMLMGIVKRLNATSRKALFCRFAMKSCAMEAHVKRNVE